MESIRVKNLSFTYAGRDEKVLEDIDFTVKKGEFVLLMGESGCGKTTLLRLLKSSLSPWGKMEGEVYFNEKLLSDCSPMEQALGIGFVFQNPESQIVTDKVWHEMSFGLENLGFKQDEIRARISEMASFFGIESWFYKNVTELSGGQKQILNLASVMVMQPDVLILDEPTSQLDPICAGEFLGTLEKINRELGTTVIITEHRLEDVFPLSDRVIVMDGGKIIVNTAPKDAGKILKENNHPMCRALPTPVRVHGEIENLLPCPMTVREGREWLEEYSKGSVINPSLIPEDNPPSETEETLIELKNVWFRYEKESPYVIKNLNMKVKKGELFAITGGNGTGKTTALSIVSGLTTPQRGDVIIKGEKISKIQSLYDGLLACLPQNPQRLFLKNTVFLDLEDVFRDGNFSKEEKEKKIQEITAICRLENLLESHPYDLSGGEQERAALAKVLLREPEILLLDEPTKGMDANFKEEFARILAKLKENGVTVLMVSHDIEFCAKYADRCALFFDGNIASEGRPREFFKGMNFYTTSANRMARTILPDAVLPEDIILACGGKVEKRKTRDKNVRFQRTETGHHGEKEKKEGMSPLRIFAGSIFAFLFLLTSFLHFKKPDMLSFPDTNRFGISFIQLISLGEFVISFLCFFGKRGGVIRVFPSSGKERKLTKGTIVSLFLTLVLIPLTIYAGISLFGNRKYFFISLLIILETLIPFCMMFEKRKPKARELIVISVLCALAVSSRAVFSALPQFKPVAGIVIISGLCFGAETGFLVGAVTGFVSNFFFGQGPWTPWQMFALGAMGFLSGIIFAKGNPKISRTVLCIFGFFTTFIIYGGITNLSSVMMWQDEITWKMIASVYASGLPFDLIHSSGTAFFLWFISSPMIEKLERIKVKYGFQTSLQ